MIGLLKRVIVRDFVLAR